MTTCTRRNLKRSGYSDWEENMQDGRIAWTEAQWVMAILENEGTSRMGFQHYEIDQ